MKNFYSILTSFLLLCFFPSCDSGVKVKQQVKSVKIEKVVTNGEKSVLQYPGRVKPAQDIDMAFRVSGQIQRILVKDGEMVKKGQLIATLDPSDYEVQFSATEAKYKQIKAEAERVIALYNDGGATPNDYDKAVYGLEQIKALYQHHKDELAYTKLYAPFDGYIQKKFFEAHETVGAGMPVISLLTRDNPEVEINIPAAEYIQRDNFVSYHCTFDIYPGKEYPLTLIGITHKANANQLYAMRLRIDADGLPKPSAGMNTMVSIGCQNEEDHSLLVPSTALLLKGQVAGVYVYKESEQKVKFCPVVSVRPLNDGRTIILSDEVSANDWVVSAGVHAIKDGEKVTPLPSISKTNIGGLL